MSTSRNLVSLALLALVALVACAGPSVSPSPSGSAPPSGSPGPSPSAPPSVGPSPSATIIPTPGPTSGAITVTSYAQAVALVLNTDPRFAGIGPQQFDMIGQCCWYEVAEDTDGWVVTVTIGSGDCMAGCIDRQTWRFHVDQQGTIELLSEEGAAEPPAWTGAGPASATIQAVAGPTCPVETNPPDPNCQPRPVVGAEIIVRALDGSELARGVTNEQGQLPLTAEPGTYWLDPQPVEGLMGTASAIALRLAPGEQAFYTLYYDTGIR